MAKQFDIKIKNGSYVNAQGETKNRYKTVGHVMQGNDGSQFALLDPTVNLAGFEREQGKDMLLASFFEPYKDENKPQQQNNQQQQQAPQQWSNQQQQPQQGFANNNQR